MAGFAHLLLFGLGIVPSSVVGVTESYLGGGLAGAVRNLALAGVGSGADDRYLR